MIAHANAPDPFGVNARHHPRGRWRVLYQGCGYPPALPGGSAKGGYSWVHDRELTERAVEMTDVIRTAYPEGERPKTPGAAEASAHRPASGKSHAVGGVFGKSHKFRRTLTADRESPLNSLLCS